MLFYIRSVSVIHPLISPSRPPLATFSNHSSYTLLPRSILLLIPHNLPLILPKQRPLRINRRIRHMGPRPRKMHHEHPALPRPPLPETRNLLRERIHLPLRDEERAVAFAVLVLFDDGRHAVLLRGVLVVGRGDVAAVEGAGEEGGYARGGAEEHGACV